MGKEKEYGDRRRYIRLNTAFPIQFQFVDEDKRPISPMFQGSTKDVSKGGMRIEAKTAKSRSVFRFVPGKTKLKLTINIPSSMISAESYGTVCWSKEISEYNLDIHIFGVEYDEIETKSQRMIYLYILWLYRRRRLLFLFIILLLIIAALLVYWGVKRS